MRCLHRNRSRTKAWWGLSWTVFQRNHRGMEREASFSSRACRCNGGAYHSLEHPLENLASGTEWQDLPEFDKTGVLVSRHFIPCPADEVGGIE